MSIGAIIISATLQHPHQRVLLRYLSDDLSLSHHDWVMLAEAVNALSTSTVSVNGQERTFRQFYAEHIDQRFADAFLVRISSYADVETEGRLAQAVIAREIGQLLDGLIGFSRDNAGCRLLMIYCLYWWAAFARGYIFEVVIFRDLTASGIQFVAHDISNRRERLAPYDLLLLDLRGDIKSTTYFLTAEHLSQLRSDFFITRWYLAAARQWGRVALLREAGWLALNPTPARKGRRQVTLDEVESVLPQAAAFMIDSQRLTALGYEQWKEQVLFKQSTGKE